MTREEFIEILDEKGYSYEIEADKLVVTWGRLGIDLTYIYSIPADVEFSIKLPPVVTESPWLPVRFKLKPVDLYLELEPPLEIVESFN